VPINVSGFPTLSLSGLTDSASIYVDLNGDLVDDVELSGYRLGYTYSAYTAGVYGRFEIDPLGTSPVVPALARNTAAGLAAQDFAANLTGGSVATAIAADSAFDAYLMYTAGGFVSTAGFVAPGPGSSESGIVGLEFLISGNIHNAWLEILISADADGRPSTLELVGGAYESTPDTDIPVGVIPEPANVGLGLGLLALGATGVRAMRRRRD
jgi:hypothetical protein